MPPAGPTKRERLAAVPLFSRLSGASLTYLAMHCEALDVAAGEVLCRQGDEGSDLIVVATGSIEVRRDGQVVSKAGPGDVLGELSVLDGRPRSADLTALEDSSVLSIDHRDLRRVVLRVPHLALELLAELATRVREARGEA